MVVSTIRRPEQIPGPSEDASPRAARHGVEPWSTERSAKVVSIDPGVALEGRVRDCDVVHVGGDVRGEIADSATLVIVEGGRFDGKAEVQDCDVAGEFIGTLLVRGGLTIRASGRVRGDIRYGTIEIEAGGQVAGNVAVGGAEEPAHLAHDVATIFGRATRQQDAIADLPEPKNK
jgi:cytoskeletal protein CcmA (bactofilin family)